MNGLVAKNVKSKKFSGLNANELEITQRIHGGMAFFDLTITFVIAAKKLNLPMPSLYRSHNISLFLKYLWMF